MTYTWSKYPDAKPNRSGYYYTYYFNNEMNDCFYKAIYYNTSADEWIGWRRGIEPKVIGYVDKTYAKFYVPCLDLVTPDIGSFLE
jgi:hypothetical protein